MKPKSLAKRRFLTFTNFAAISWSNIARFFCAHGSSHRNRNFTHSQSLASNLRSSLASEPAVTCLIFTSSTVFLNHLKFTFSTLKAVLIPTSSANLVIVALDHFQAPSWIAMNKWRDYAAHHRHTSVEIFFCKIVLSRFLFEENSRDCTDQLWLNLFS